MDSRRDALVRDHLELVDHVVRRVSGSFPGHIDRQELVAAGRLGLTEAALRYDFDREVPFGAVSLSNGPGQPAMAKDQRVHLELAVNQRLGLKQEMASIRKEHAAAGDPLPVRVPQLFPSWKLAALKNESVLNDALVIPRSS